MGPLGPFIFVAPWMWRHGRLFQPLTSEPPGDSRPNFFNGVKILIYVGAISLGCAKNRVDTEIMLGLLGQAGYGMTADPQRADLLLVNTCAFITPAARESIKTILEAGRYKQEGRLRAVVVTGCLVQRYGAALVREMPEIDAVLGTGEIGKVALVAKQALQGKKPVVIGRPGFVNTIEPRLVTTPLHTAYLKIAEGCSNCCSFCLIPSLRGPYRSRKREDIMAEAVSLASRGAKELVLVAQDATRWGTDLYGRAGLPGLLRELARLDGVRWVRVLYAYPAGVSEELLATLAEEEKICKYLDIPLQHVSPYLLKAMNRPVIDARELVRRIRSTVPGIAIRSTFIVGFPGETEADFAAVEEALREIKFDHVGVFAYSREDGAPAAGFAGQVPWKVKRERAGRLRKLARDLSILRNRERVGQEILVLVEGKRGRFFYGRSEADAPEVDGRVYFTSEQPIEPGDFAGVRITGARVYDVVGEAVKTV